MKDLKIVIKLLMKERKDVFLSILFGFLAGAGAVALFANSGYLISQAAIASTLVVLTMSIALMKIFSVTRAVSRYGERYFSHRATFTKLSSLRVYFFERLEPLAPRVFNRYRSGDILARIVGDVESLQNFFLRVYYPPIVMVIVFLATITFTLFFSVYIALILAAGLFITGFLVPLLFALKQRKIQNELREMRGNLSAEAAEFFYGFRDLKLYQKLDEQEQQLGAVSNAYISEQEKNSLQALFSQSVNQMIALIISWFVLGAGAYLIAGGELAGIFLAMLVMISLTVFDTSTPMAAFPVHFEDSRRAASRLFSVVEEGESPDEEPGGRMEKHNLREAPAVEMNHVSFSFPGEERETLKDINLHLPAGSKTAIVGPSGSGKSTLLQLLFKMYPEYAGEVRLNGRLLEELEDESVWAGINPVLQNNHFFYGTVKENLLLAKDDLSDEAMNDVLGKVKLSFSLDKQILEKGENLSGGEKQRLAIARAMLKGAKLWLLDEPTSSVDVLTERVIFDHLLEQGKEDTLVLISHRLTGLEKMDKIIVMEQGRIIESGSLDDLMSRKGYFYEMKQIEKSVFA
ncbi:thiol reductant ABC exporter subunit CydC [Evansella sp. LMS18]|uniref:thiol reductant ABC exporter subunit CydC n=1 Tax=Evansella sp. LMS18 TaxID=2924033 RepID=UPI0020D16A7E|nr:thiol reductant ABC exporter subunit CydC [Evansella sp. LMS18]UTR08639.1 thiol reductant ABC exporter subunit CydC [Evansella sp. LMS18]